jgi:branched-chain amino acid aminotransferase
LDLKIVPRDERDRKPRPTDESRLEFGKIFSDHFFHMSFESGRGWHEAAIEPYRSLELDPASIFLHYSQQVFEGLKAYRGKGDGIYLFRARDNLERLNRSARRLCMPEVDIDFVMEALRRLLLLDRAWIPGSPGTSLYIRPTMIATEVSLGVKVSSTYLFYIIIGPAGAYYKEGFNPVRIFVTDKYTRAVRGGVGDCKTGANYAASLLAAEEAARLGYTQVLWLDAIERRYVEEVGTSNVFFLMGDTLVTPELSGSIMPGITRDSVIRIVADWGVKLEERAISIDEVLEGAQKGDLKEAFATGTAAVISPIKELFYKGEAYRVSDGNTGKLAKSLYEEILELQYGEKEDPYGWIERIDR